MKDDLERFIAQNRALFDCDDLPQGGEERFFAKWEARRSGRRRHLRFLGVAASVVALLAGWGVREFAFGEAAVEARMLRHYRQQIEVLKQQLDGYVADLSPAGVERIEDAMLLFRGDVEAFTEWLPREISPAQRRKVLEDYYARHLAGMEQMVLLMME